MTRTVFSREQGSSFEHLCKDATRAPNIDGDVVLLPCEHDFWSTIVSCRDISRHLWVLYPGQTEIADLEIAIFVH